MKTKNLLISKLVPVPFPFWMLTFLIILIPFFLDNPSGGAQEYIWFIYIIPAFIFSYYWGIWGGIVTALITVSAQIIYELMERYFETGDYNKENYIVIVITSLISVAIAFGIGLLASQLKKVNLTLQSKNKQLDYLSHMDELTGLPNRRGLLRFSSNWLHEKKREHQTFGILFIDLDKFKPINDTLGRQIGDTLLIEVAKRLIQSIHDEAIISRVGGDEFAIFLKNADESSSIQKAQEIIHYLSDKFLIDGKEIFITPSIGISLSSTSENEIELLLQQADIAMYYVKRKGRNGFLLFDQSMKEVTENRINLESQLHHAIEKEEFVLYYQPQLDIKTEQIVNFEALIRWYSNGKIVSPAEFIPVAEETGLIIPIGKWVLETACRKIKEHSFPISVNVSSHQFQQPDFVENVRRVLTETGIDPKLLTLELTETVILGNEKIIINKLNELKQLGISLSIDDFGSGYSSLTYLKDFPIDEIKMDKSFIDEITYNLKDRSLVHTIIRLGESLNAKIVAEGVETLEQLTYLKEIGCDIIQGYFISKPMPIIEMKQSFQNSFASET